MRRLQIIGLCLLAVCAGGASAADVAAAHARPEYVMCEKLEKNPETRRYTGRYGNATCTEVDAAGEGRYEMSAVKVPYGFEGKSKAATISYYGEHGEGVLWKVECKKGLDRGVITSPTTGTVNVTLESCKAIDMLSAEKPVKCLMPITAALETRTEESVPGERPAVVLTPGFARPFTCGSDTFGKDSGFEIGEIEDAGKGPVAVLAAGPGGEQAIQRFYWFEEGVTEGAFLYGSVNGSPLYVGLETTVALGPDREVVVAG